MKIRITNTFKRAAKKLPADQKKLLEKAIDSIAKNPEIGELKKGDLAGIRVYKFHIHHQLILVAYSFEKSSSKSSVITLLFFSPHENFYDQLNKNPHSLSISRLGGTL